MPSPPPRSTRVIVTARAQLEHEFTDTPVGSFKRAQVAELATDVKRYSVEVQPVQARKTVEHVGCLGDGDAELVLTFACRNLGVGAPVDIWIDPQNRRRPNPAALGETCQNTSFLFQLEVELADPGIQRIDKLAVGLADTGEHNPGRRHPRIEGATQFASRHDVRAIAAFSEQPEHCCVGVGLDRKGEPGGLKVTESRCETVGSVTQGTSGIDVDRRAHGVSDLR